MRDYVIGTLIIIVIILFLGGLLGGVVYITNRQDQGCRDKYGGEWYHDWVSSKDYCVKKTLEIRPE